ncbi:MAG: hypothetical protein HY026_10835 [Deltaproteobacteria bacterium]|nr:hypothetical protein [Deltaproteobacteria bacterium]
MTTYSNPNPHTHHEPIKYGGWYKWGLAFIWVEGLFSLAVVVYAMYMALTGAGGIVQGK